MFDKLETKVKEIRKQPEHVRERYVWMAVAVVMFVVIFIWLLSMRISFNKTLQDTQTKQNVEEIQKRINEMKGAGDSVREPKTSIDDLLLQEDSSL